MVWTSEVETGSILVVKTKPDLRTKEGKNMYNRANYLNRKLKRKTVAMNAELETVCSSADGSCGCPTPYLSTPDGRSEYNRAYYKKRKAAGTLHGDTKRPYNRTYFPKRQPGNQGFQNTSCKKKPEDTPIAEGENTEEDEESTSSEEKPEEAPIAEDENTEDAEESTFCEEKSEDNPIAEGENTEDVLSRTNKVKVEWMLEPCDEVVVNFQNVINTVDAKVAKPAETGKFRLSL
jgi:hypothetical protein